MKRFRMRGPAVVIAASSLGILVVTGALAAHDFWVVPDAFQIASGAVLEVRGQTGTGATFPASQSAVTPDRVAEARLVGAASDERITDLAVSNKSLLIRHKPASAGQRVVAVALVSRSTRTTPERLKRYIALEGNPDLAERYERDGAYPKTDSLTQVSAKFAKTIVEVGRGGPRAFSRTVGHVLELVPVNDPAELRVDDSLAVRLLYRGQPVAGLQLHAGGAGAAEATQGAESRPKDVTVMTGSDGIARVPLDRDGIWNVRTLYAAPAAGRMAEWEVPFATLVFSVNAATKTPFRSTESRGEVALDRSPRRATASDSADVAAVVRGYGADLAAGDSAAALRLLAPDAVVLESGDIETLEEYRSGHLAADINSARALPSTTGTIRVAIRGDVAWASSASTRKGESRGRQVNSRGAELMVLSRETDGWKIRAIHWSSRPQRTPGG